MLSIFSLPIAEQFECGRYRGFVHRNENAFYATYTTLNGTRSRGWNIAFPTIDECREYLRSSLDRMTTETRARSLATRKRRREQKIARVVKDYLLGKHIGNSNTCAICGRALSDPPSIARAIGSECWPRLQDRLAREVPRCTANIEQIQQAIAEHEKHDLAYWQAFNAQRYSHVAPDMINNFTAHDLRQTHNTIETLKRQLRDTELLLAAARRWAATPTAESP